MSASIKPGTMVRITVTRRPTNDSAAKTLTRVFLKDAARGKAGRRQKRMLQGAVRFRRRGGRPWGVRPHVPRPVPALGEACDVRATLDVINDLGSVSRFVEVKSAP